MDMMKERFGDKVLCNPVVKLKKGQKYPNIQIDKISPGYKYVNTDEIIEYDGQGGCKFEDHDVLMARITPCLENGKLAIADTNGNSGIGSTELFVFRGIEGVSDTDYIYYLLRTSYMKKHASNSMTGASGRQRADLGFIKKIPWSFPTIDRQKEIVSALSQYDLAIENNIRRITILEQIIDNLFKEWFVRFRFPGYEDIELKNGIPSGWEYKRADELIIINPTLTVKDQEQFKIIPMDALSTTSMVINDESCYLQEEISGRRSQNGDTLLAKITPCLENGKTGFVMGLMNDEVAGGSTEFIVLRSKAVNPFYVYCLARSEYFRQTAIMSMNGADGRQRVNEDKLKALKVICPAKEILCKFEDVVSKIFREINIIMKKNNNLKVQRDMLLPRLISGKLQID